MTNNPQKETTLASTEKGSAEVLAFFDEHTNTYSYIVEDLLSGACVIVDSVLDFDYASGRISYDSADAIIECVQQRKLEVAYLLETHVHADHLSAAPYIQSVVGGKIAISQHIVDVQAVFGRMFNEGTEFERDGSQFDVLLEDGQCLEVGHLKVRAIHTPGHTPACMTFVIGDAVFVGDTLFMPDSGTARADFPGGDARTLFRSIKKVLTLPDTASIYVCHDYPPDGREPAYLTSVAEQKRNNIHVKEGIGENEFVAMREARDAGLAMPQLIYPSLQVNMRAGHFPDPEDNQTTYLKVPISGLKRTLLAHPEKADEPRFDQREQ